MAPPVKSFLFSATYYELATCAGITAFAKLLVMICDYPDTGIPKAGFEVFCQTPKTGLISICPLHMDVQPSTKSYQLQEGGEREKQPPDKGLTRTHYWTLDHAEVSAPIPQL